MDRFQSLRNKEVIDICEGERLGFVCDVEIDICNGRIVAIVVPGRRGFGFFGKHEEVVIPWRNICKIGDDIIIVNLRPKHLECD
ncbi:MAG: PRC-barrel domain protein [Firmicutes bacterium ADurb.Bin193]|nr:MAG: PRC-barrel domain protein [Firmicutes bacterium ADurb.Bin193]